MPTVDAKTPQRKPGIRIVGRTNRTVATGSASHNSVEIVRSVRAGFPFQRLIDFQKSADLPWTELSRFVAIPRRTLERRRIAGRLRPDESERVLRASRIFDAAAELFEGDIAAARNWLLKPQSTLGGESPIDFATTEVGAREVENLIGRLEHGVFA